MEKIVHKSLGSLKSAHEEGESYGDELAGTVHATTKTQTEWTLCHVHDFHSGSVTLVFLRYA
jgi:hypothetical protein